MGVKPPAPSNLIISTPSSRTLLNIVIPSPLQLRTGRANSGLLHRCRGRIKVGVKPPAPSTSSFQRCHPEPPNLVYSSAPQLLSFRVKREILMVISNLDSPPEASSQASREALALGIRVRSIEKLSLEPSRGAWAKPAGNPGVSPKSKPWRAGRVGPQRKPQINRLSSRALPQRNPEAPPRPSM